MPSVTGDNALQPLLPNEILAADVLVGGNGHGVGWAPLVSKAIDGENAAMGAAGTAVLEGVLRGMYVKADQKLGESARSFIAAGKNPRFLSLL